MTRWSQPFRYIYASDEHLGFYLQSGPQPPAGVQLPIGMQLGLHDGGHWGSHGPGVHPRVIVESCMGSSFISFQFCYGLFYPLARVYADHADPKGDRAM